MTLVQSAVFTKRIQLRCDTLALVEDSTKSPALPALYIVGIPGKVGGASTKIAHLIRLLHQSFAITVIASEPTVFRSKEVNGCLRPFSVPCVMFNALPPRMNGVCLGICDPTFFSSGKASNLKGRGLKIVWSNEMMFLFKGEADAVRSGIIDRVLFVSEFQAQAFSDLYRGIPSRITGNYIDPEEFPEKIRTNEVFTIGRLSRPDPSKFPLDFPVFYEEFRLPEVRFRIMAWDHELQKRYKWHSFGPQWELLHSDKQSSLEFLHSLDLFVYTLSHRFKESWGRAIVEAMLTGCVPVVPNGHQFERLIVSGENGFICSKFEEFKSVVQELFFNYRLREKISRECAMSARKNICDPSFHRKIWGEALTF